MSEQFEEWRRIAYAPNYEVSDWGRIRRIKTQKLIQKQIRPGGTMTVALFRDGEQTIFSVSNLVWNTFREPVRKGQRFDHINGDLTDDRLVNLLPKPTKEEIMKLTKETFAASLDAAIKEKETDAPGSVADEIARDLKLERTAQITKPAARSQVPVKENPERVKATVKETPETAPTVSESVPTPLVHGTIHGPLRQVWTMLFAAGLGDMEATVTFGTDR